MAKNARAQTRTAAAAPAPAKPAKPALKSAPKMAEKSIKAVAKHAEPAAEVERPPQGRSWAQGGLPRQSNRDAERAMRLNPDVLCRSCGKRPGRPTAIIGQLTATELCEVCANLRKERIRANRASQRGYRL